MKKYTIIYGAGNNISYSNKKRGQTLFQEYGTNRICVIDNKTGEKIHRYELLPDGRIIDWLNY